MTKQIDARALVARLNREGAALQEREIVAPLLLGGKIRTRHNGLVYQFKPKGNFTGWGRFHPVNEREAEVLGEALPWQRAAYLELFPALRVILLWPFSGSVGGREPPSANSDKNRLSKAGVWLALPFNESDAQQRFGLSGTELVPIFLCDPLGGAQAFERIVARVDGKTLWFDSPDVLADPIHAEWLREAAAQSELTEKFLPGLAGSERLALIFWQIHQLEVQESAIQPHLPTAQNQTTSRRSQREQQIWLRQQAEHNRLEQQLQHALAKADATLHSYSETLNPDGTSGHLVVEWSEQGQTYRYRSVIDRNLAVVSSGICLSGRDQDFDLTSLVNVMTNSEAD
ncbi:MAG: hypothetical protein WCS37_00515 [Chloroflexota bacterium]